MDNMILIATIENDIYLRPLGHITANLCFPLREMIFKKIAQFHVHFSIFVDLSLIQHMDSTFLGLLVGIDKRLSSFLETHLYVINPNSISLKLLKNMGLDRFLNIIDKEIDENACFTPFDDEILINEVEKTKIVLSSHKELICLSDINKKRFKTLTEILEKKIEDKK